ncbi:hypothetical protein MSG28_006507 [Choristoneura fumiferana]|uniref:Uncharacterized protein n=1 Tax=Choristoneura fumiferana TaxID=7141 RepID=A0ACC0JFD7_CHOFU|nr:hypothetical protein MSG28_006507 [Choristoneura fumiferana]
MLNKRVWGLAICLFVVAVAVNVTASSDQKGDSPSKSKFTTPYLIGALVVAAVLAVVYNKLTRLGAQLLVLLVLLPNCL